MPAPVKEFVLTHIVKNASSLKKDEYSCSEEKEHFNVPWKVGVTRKDEFMGFYLYCMKPLTSKWSIEVEKKLKLASATGRMTSCTAPCTFESSSEFIGYGKNEFIKWEDMEKDYMVDGDLMVEAHVKILKMTGIEKKKLKCFDESAKEFSDIVLVAGNEKFYVSKLFLSCQSTYFDALFLRKFKESDKAEITLKDVDSKDFQNFLELLYGESPIDDYTVDRLLKLSDMYDAKLAIRKCEMFLINESEKTLKEKLQMAKLFNLENLKTKSLSQVKTADDIRSVVSCNLIDMEPSVLAALLQKALTLLP